MIISLKIYKDFLRLLLVIIGILLLPMSMNFITMLAKDGDVHSLMIYSFVLLFVAGIKLIDIICNNVSRYDKNKSFVRCIIVLLLLFVWNNFCISNMAYLRLQVCYENSYALANRIVARVEMLDGYSSDLPVAIVGEASRKLYGNTVAQFSQINSLTGTNDTLFYSPEPHIRTRTFIEHYIGLHMPRINTDQIKILEESGVLNDMDSYPGKDSIAIYSGIVIVKLSDGNIR